MTYLRRFFPRKPWPLPPHVSQPLNLALLSVGMARVNRLDWRGLAWLAYWEMDRE